MLLSMGDWGGKGLEKAGLWLSFSELVVRSLFHRIWNVAAGEPITWPVLGRPHKLGRFFFR